MAYQNQTKKEIRLTSLGTLELNFKLTLTLNQLESIGIKICQLKKFSDLSLLFSCKSFEIIDQIALSTDNYLINTLLYINRTNKQKTFIEYLTTSEIFFSPEDLFFKSILKKITDRHFLFIIQNRITTIPSDIIFTLTIINSITNKLHSIKSFFLPTTTYPIDEDIPSSSSLLTMLGYKCFYDYFFCNFSDLIKIQTTIQNEDIIYCLLNDLNSKYPKVNIICTFTNDLFSKNTNISFIDLMKKLIEFSDITIVDNDVLDQFYKHYTQKHCHQYNYSHDHCHQSNYFNNKDAIIQDANRKERKAIGKITLFLDQMKTISLIQQDRNGKIIKQNSDFYLYVNRNAEEQRIIMNNYHYFQSVFIGGFISRLLYHKTYHTCYIAANKSFKLALSLIKKHIDISPDLSYYEVVVYNKKKKFIDLTALLKRQYFNQREKAFKLDGNQSDLKLIDYNAINDNSCSSFYNSFFHQKHLKRCGFVIRRRDRLKDPITQGSMSQERIENVHRKTLIQLNINKRIMKNSCSSSYLNQTMKNSGRFNNFQQRNLNSSTNIITKEDNYNDIENNNYTKTKVNLEPIKTYNKSNDDFSNKSRGKYIPKDAFYKVLNEYEEKVRNNLNKGRNESYNNNIA